MKNPNYQYTSVAQGLPNFLTFDLAILNTSQSISHSSPPLATEPIRNTEIVESLLLIDYES